MDSAALMQAIQALAPICTKPEHQALLLHLASQPAPFVELMVSNLARHIDPAQIATMVDSEFGHLDVATRESLKGQALSAHNFLSQSMRE